MSNLVNAIIARHNKSIKESGQTESIWFMRKQTGEDKMTKTIGKFGIVWPFIMPKGVK